MNLIRIYKPLPRFALDIDLHFGQESLVLFGPSGAGKSLTLQAIAGLLTPQAGRIEIQGMPLYDNRMGLNLPPQLRRIGYVMQDYALFPHLTVSENIAFGLHGLPRAEQQQRLGEVMSLLRLEGLEGRRPPELSGGQQQRVALARALVTRPLLLLLDEPFAALDSPMRARLRRELLALQRRIKLPMIFVTHDLAEAHMLADRMAVMDEGHLLQVGTPDELLRHPASRSVARFTGARNIFVGRIAEVVGERYRIVSRRGTLYARGRREAPPFEVGQLVECCVRPENITLVRPGEEEGRSARGQSLLVGTIVEELDHGLFHTLFVHLEHAGTSPSHVDLEIELSDRSYRLLAVAQNRRWTLAIKEEAVHIIGPATSPYFEGPAPQPVWDENNASNL